MMLETVGAVKRVSLFVGGFVYRMCVSSLDKIRFESCEEIFAGFVLLVKNYKGKSNLIRDG